MPSQSSPGKRLLLVAALGGLLGLSGGCSGEPPLTEVKGHVKLNGQTMTSGTVNFHPDKDQGNTFGGECVGDINAQGEYTLHTSRGGKGAPLGWYKVTVSQDAPVTADNTNPSTTSSINTTFSNVGTTTLKKQVVDKASPGAYDLDVGP